MGDVSITLKYESWTNLIENLHTYGLNGQPTGNFWAAIQAIEAQIDEYEREGWAQLAKKAREQWGKEEGEY